nr:MAG TPA: minor tail protein [Caudoviricetes sp.]
MSMTLEELKVIINAEIAPFKKQMKEVENQVKNAANNVKSKTSSIKSAFGKLAAFTGFAILGKKLLDLGMYSTQTALEVSAAMNQIKRQMGESSQSFLKWVNDNANAMNMSVGEATKYGAVYSNLFSGFIKDTNKLSAYTAKMLQTSAVVAEGTGRSITDVMERIRSGLLGNTEAIEDLGINVNVAMIESTEAFKRFANGQSWQQLDYQTQQQIRLMAILEQATAKYGNTLSQSVNSRISLFKSLLKDAALNVGNALLPIINAVMPVLNSFAMVLKNVTNKLAEFIALMFNKKATVKEGSVASAGDSLQNAAQGAGDLADAMGDADDASGGIADNLDDAGKAAKKAVKELLGLAGFDEINALKKQDDSDDGAGAGSKGGKGKGGKGGGGPFKDILPEVALEDMNNNFKSIFDGWGDKLRGLLSLFSAGFNAAFRAEGLERIQKALERIKRVLTEIATDPLVVSSFSLMTQKIAYALGQIAGSIATVGVAVGVFLAESIASGLERQKERIKKALIALFTNIGNISESIGNIAQALSSAFYDVMTSIGAIRIGAAIVSAILSVGSRVVEIGSNFAGDLFKGFEKIITENAPLLADTLSTALNNIAPVFETIERAVNDFGDTFSRVYKEHIKPFVDSIFGGISDIVTIFLESFDKNINPVLEDFGRNFRAAYNDYIKPAADRIGEAVGGIFDALKKLWEEVLQPLIAWIAENILPLLAPIVEFIGSGIISNITMLFEVLAQLLEILRGIIDFIVGVFTGDWELAWQGIIEVLHGIFDPIIGWFSETFQGAWDAIVNIFNGLGAWFGERWNDVVNALSLVGSWFTQKFQEAWSGLTKIFSGLGAWFGERWNDVTSALSNVANWFGNIFGQAFNAVKNAFSSIGSFFSGVWDTVKSIFINAGQMVGDAVGGAFSSAVNAVLGTIENIVNGFIGMINGVIGIINMLPGVSLGEIGYVNLPRLARGGIVDSPTVAMIGEAGKEVVMPLENTGFLQTMGRVVGGAVVNALGGNLPQSGGFTGDGDIVIVIGNQEFGRFAIKEINRAQEEAGEILLNI